VTENVSLVFKTWRGNSEILYHVAKARDRGCSIVVANGCFDLFHAGHAHLFNWAAQLKERSFVIAAVNTDESVARLKGPTRPIVSLNERMYVLASLRSVDLVVAFAEDEPTGFLVWLSPDILVKGAEYVEQIVPGEVSLRAIGGLVLHAPTWGGLSTGNIVDRVFQSKI
jgi:D-beta-D-heptose 7-phosphate kinase/D-beta-D-heptose 1-phosphate adenosyltransferase